jgi:hypothetical protein
MSPSGKRAMCNAWNHSVSCGCGFGGTTRYGSAGGSGLADYCYESYVNPNARCPVCGARVFFYESPYGGRVFFDDLGPPWPKHPCTDGVASFRPSFQDRFQEREAGAADPRWKNDGWLPFGFSDVISDELRIRGSLIGQYRAVGV